MKKLFPVLMVMCLVLFYSCPKVEEDESLEGTWAQEASWLVEEVTVEGRVVFTLGEEDIEMLFYMRDGDWILAPGGSFRGTYEVDDDIITVTLTEMMNDGVWEAASDTGTAKYDIEGDEMDLIIDYTEDGIYDDSNPFSEHFPGGESGPESDLLFELTKED